MGRKRFGRGCAQGLLSPPVWRGIEVYAVVAYVLKDALAGLRQTDSHHFKALVPAALLGTQQHLGQLGVRRDLFTSRACSLP